VFNSNRNLSFTAGIWIKHPTIAFKLQLCTELLDEWLSVRKSGNLTVRKRARRSRIEIHVEVILKCWKVMSNSGRIDGVPVNTWELWNVNGVVDVLTALTASWRTVSCELQQVFCYSHSGSSSLRYKYSYFYMSVVVN
jgi:hypothetical protein